MLYQAMQKACAYYHRTNERGRRAGTYWDALNTLRSTREGFWRTPSRFAQSEAVAIVAFVASWTRGYAVLPSQLWESVQQALTEMRELWSKDLLSTDLNNDEVQEAIVKAFRDIAIAGGGDAAYTGASKVLHALNPELFVMWDANIRGAYGAIPSTAMNDFTDFGKVYANVFLPRVQLVVRKAVWEASQALSKSPDDVVECLLPSGLYQHSLTKLVDEYNWVKTRPVGSEVWQAEYGV